VWSASEQVTPTEGSVRVASTREGVGERCIREPEGARISEGENRLPKGFLFREKEE